MNELQKKALKQAAAELGRAENIVLMKAEKDFGSPVRRDTPASEVMELVRSAQEWITLVQGA